MNPHQTLYRYLWATPHVLLLGIAVVMWVKRLHRDFPVFFAYLVFEFLQFSLLFAMYLHLLRVSGWVYTQFDLYGRIGSIALHFGILHELFESPVKHNSSLRQSAGRTLNWVTGALVVIASVLIFIQYSDSVGHSLLTPYATIEALNIAQCVLLALIVVWHRFLHLHMSTMLFGIAVGMGLYASIDPIAQAWKDSVPSTRIPDYVQMIAYNCAVLSWLGAALAHKTSSGLSKSPLGTGLPVPSRDRLLEARQSVDELERAVVQR
ncbi:MAG TPA: hypothetical protein VMI10_25700 [Terriglobales bacterium]|nr:hypothetical protein [Terriglobales bacterium]